MRRGSCEARLHRLVVPANAGTHNHRALLVEQSRRPSVFTSLPPRRRVPAFAGTTERHGSYSRGAISPSYAILSRLLETEGAGNAGCALHPRSRVPMRKRKWRARAYRCSGGSPTSPAQWLYGLLRALPGERLVVTVAAAYLLPDLTPASWRQDHTTWPYALAFRPAHKRAPDAKASIAIPAPYVS